MLVSRQRNLIEKKIKFVYSLEADGNTKIIVNYAAAGEIPYIVSLRVHLNNFWQHYCSGSIIRPSWVLTAAACISLGVGDDGYVVRAGTTFQAAPYGYERRSIKVIGHRENTKKDVIYADIGLMQLNKPFIYNEFVQPIVLETKYITNGIATASGWGYIIVSRLFVKQ